MLQDHFSLDEIVKMEHEGLSIGVTGTRKGGTRRQIEGIRRLLTTISVAASNNKKFVELHHGDCVGIDLETYMIARKVFVNVSANLITVGHPPVDRIHRAFTENVQTRIIKPYLTRNMDIVNESDWLLALPDSSHEKQRSGTWSTIRYAKKQGKQVLMILPSGVIRTSG